jgi:hypothetical protein
MDDPAVILDSILVDLGSHLTISCPPDVIWNQLGVIWDQMAAISMPFGCLWMSFGTLELDLQRIRTKRRFVVLILNVYYGSWASLTGRAKARSRVR